MQSSKCEGVMGRTASTRQDSVGALPRDQSGLKRMTGGTTHTYSDVQMYTHRITRAVRVHLHEQQGRRGGVGAVRTSFHASSDVPSTSCSPGRRHLV